MKAAREQAQTMQRIRVGIIGLVAVVLLIGLASAIIGSATQPPPRTAASGNDVIANLLIDNVAMAGGEPLAELGAAPGTVNEQDQPAR